MTTSERMAHIDKQFDISLGVFDGHIRDEQAVIAGQRSGQGGSGSGANAGSAGEEAGSGDGSDGEGKEGDGQGQGQGGEQGQGQGQQGQGSGQGAGSTGSSQGGSGTGGGGGVGGGGKGGGGPNTVPADIPDGSDDDVVARQLREAAMAETDPELREKLWEEYRLYKKGS